MATTTSGIGKIQTEADLENFVKQRLQPIDQLVRQVQGTAPFAGNGSPEGVVAASTGSLYVNQSGGAGSTFWVKETSPTPSTGWVPK